MNEGQALGSSAYTPYTGEQLAPLNSQQQQSFNMASQLPGQENSLFNAATGMTAGAVGNYQSPTFNAQQIGAPTQWNSSEASQYMSPYIGSALSAGMANLGEQNQQQIEQINSQAAAQGSFGGANNATAIANQNYLSQLAGNQLSSSMLNTGYNSALSAFQNQQALGQQGQIANQQANLQAQGLGAQYGLAGAQLGLAGAQTLSGIGSSQQAANIGDINALQTSGGIQQAQVQSGENINYQNFQSAQWGLRLSTRTPTQCLNC